MKIAAAMLMGFLDDFFEDLVISLYVLSDVFAHVIIVIYLTSIAVL